MLHVLVTVLDMIGVVVSSLGTDIGWCGCGYRAGSCRINRREYLSNDEEAELGLARIRLKWTRKAQGFGVSGCRHPAFASSAIANHVKPLAQSFAYVKQLTKLSDRANRLVT